ncbi:MAG: GNAT family N-acetyltransferase [Actinobacteria bacterium]|nr:GNAT family N-acetyltransferase [Actinomycetota bacterium]
MASHPNGPLAEPYRVRIVDHDLARCGLASWWNRLPQPQRSTMLRWEYLSTWADAFVPRAACLHIPVVFSGSTPVAALPLYRTGRLLRSLANDAHSDVFDVGCDPAHPSACDTLVAHLLRYRTCLERLDGSSPLLAGLRRAAPPMIVDPAQSPWIQLPATPDAMLAQLSSKFRAGVRRAERALATLGTVTLRDHRSGDPEFEQAFSTLLDLEAASWKGTQGNAITLRPETLRFYRRLAVTGPVRRWARVAVLRVDDRVVAAQFDLEHDAVRTGLKMASTADLGRGQSPGTVLLWHVVRDCISRGLTRLELGGELEGWKRHWTTTGADRTCVRTWPRTLTGQLTFGAREQVKQAVRPLRATVGSRQRTDGS